jgi:ATP-binding cassette, subfamily D (ALD), peroxisomal long-chain fatty acid import protein
MCVQLSRAQKAFQQTPSSLAYISDRCLLLSPANAGGWLSYAYKDILELPGLTTRSYTLISTLLILPPLPPGEIPKNNEIVVEHVDVCTPLSQYPPPNGSSTTNGHTDLSESQYSDSLRKAFIHPPLVKDLSFVLKEGEHLMITGSNRVGKSSSARVEVT